MFSRLTRNRMSMAFALKQFRSAGVGLVSVSEHVASPPETDFLDGLSDVVKAYSGDGFR